MTDIPTPPAKHDARGPVLLGLARAAIADIAGTPPPAAPAPAWLQEKGASFVTLTQAGQLRGCIGSLQPYRPLLLDVVANARAAAFSDPRFSPLDAVELAYTRIEVSLLSALEPLPARSETEARRQLRPHIDGLVLEWRQHRGTFLPQVWEALPNPEAFLSQLKRKAGLPASFWAEDVRLFRYHVTKWSEPEQGPEQSHDTRTSQS